MKLRHATLTALGLAVLFSTSAVALVFIAQSFPLVSAQGIASNCVSPTELRATPATVVPTSNGRIRFDCPFSPAFTSAAGTVATPVFVLTLGYSTLWIIMSSTPAGGPATCAAGVGAIQLTTAAPVTFSATTEWDYCAEFLNAPATGLLPFGITWASV